MSTKPTKLVEQQQALDDFFESLMHDVQAYAETEYAPPPPVEAPAVPVAAVASPPPVAEAAPAEPAPTDAKPAWASSPFQVLLFKVAGLTLAVPLVELNGVVDWSARDVTQMPGHADFYMGLIRHLDHNVALIDTARLVMPADRLASLASDDPYKRVTHVVLIHDSCYGLGCDEIAEVVTLQPDAVRWRTSRTQRRWLAGTVVAHMCALIDAPAFAQMLADRLPVKAFRE